MRTGISRAVLAAAAALAAPLATPAQPGGYVPITPTQSVSPTQSGAMSVVAELPPTAAIPPTPEPTGRRAPAVPGKVVVLQKDAGDDVPKAARDGSDAFAPDPGTKSVYEQRYGRLPDKQQVFQLESQPALERRILHELKRDDTPKELAENRFPPPPKLVPDGATYVPKTVNYPTVQAMIEPGYVVHRRLYFEEKNAERYGWDLGFIQPVTSTLTFYKDTLLFPAKLMSNPHERYDTSAGKCVPGNPVPYYIYPPEVDIWGAAFAAGIYTGTAFLFP